MFIERDLSYDWYPSLGFSFNDQTLVYLYQLYVLFSPPFVPTFTFNINLLPCRKDSGRLTLLLSHV